MTGQIIVASILKIRDVAWSILRRDQVCWRTVGVPQDSNPAYFREFRRNYESIRSLRVTAALAFRWTMHIYGRCPKQAPSECRKIGARLARHLSGKRDEDLDGWRDVLINYRRASIPLRAKTS